MGRALTAAWGALVLALLAGPLRDLLPALATELTRGWGAWSPAGAAAAAGRHARVILLAAGMATGLWLAGWAALRWSGPRRAAPLHLLAAYPLGYAAASLLTLGLALVRLWYPPLLALAILAPATACLAGGRPRWTRPVAGPRLPLLAAAAALVLLLPWLLAPESQPDGWEYFLAAPERWLALHGYAASNATPMFHYPYLAEMLYGLPVAAGLDQVPKWLHALALVCGVAAAAAAWRPGTLGWPLLLVTTSATGTFLITCGKNEGFSAGFILLSFAWGWAPDRPRRGAGPLLGAVFAGCALSTKLMSPLNALWVPVILFGPGLRERWRTALAWGGIALAVATPWYVKAWLVTGDPMYPVLSGYWPGLIAGWDARNGELWRRCTSVGMPWSTFGGRLAMAFIREHAVMALLLPGLLLAAGPGRRIAMVVCGVHAFWFAALYNPQTERWAFPGLAILLVLAGGAAADWAAGSRRRRWALGACLAAGALHGLGSLGVAPNPLPLALGAATPAAYTERILTTRMPLDAWLTRFPTARATLLLGDVREYRLPHPVRVGSAHGSGEPLLIWRLAGACAGDRDFRVKFRQLNVERIIYDPMTAINNGGFFRPFAWTPRQLTAWRAFFGRWWEPEYRAAVSDHANGMYFTYRLRQAARPAPAWLAHLPGTETVTADAADLANHLPPGKARFAGYRREIERRVPRVALYADQAAFVAREEGFNAEAWTLYRPGVAAGIVDDENFPGFGIVALRLGRPAEALAAFERSRDTYPDWQLLMEDYAARARFILARQLLAANPAEADRVLSAGLDRLTASPHAGQLRGPRGLLRLGRAWVRFRLGRPAEAMADLAAAATVIPEAGTLPLPQLPALVDQAARQVLTMTGNEDRFAPGK